eukprot:gnl/TRDRNA2_/TRDRNA2_44444_c0_seq1.p1 gnl/TRDRNA2_/TRDRNA2_44444_c0~~gnl/TRDRNA2_/TRDRNA2_44444_c0_seq1.p1  ORF type:complete len:557 (-),score=156.96 gnl/TRDRNA2_/TRDRNA2_44444_c0_seq1:79-1749(-)
MPAPRPPAATPTDDANDATSAAAAEEVQPPPLRTTASAKRAQILATGAKAARHQRPSLEVRRALVLSRFHKANSRGNEASDIRRTHQREPKVQQQAAVTHRKLVLAKLITLRAELLRLMQQGPTAVKEELIDEDMGMGSAEPVAPDLLEGDGAEWAQWWSDVDVSDVSCRRMFDDFEAEKGRQWLAFVAEQEEQERQLEREIAHETAEMERSREQRCKVRHEEVRAALEKDRAAIRSWLASELSQLHERESGSQSGVSNEKRTQAEDLQPAPVQQDELMEAKFEAVLSKAYASLAKARDKAVRKTLRRVQSWQGEFDDAFLQRKATAADACKRQEELSKRRSELVLAGHALLEEAGHQLEERRYGALAEQRDKYDAQHRARCEELRRSYEECFAKLHRAHEADKEEVQRRFEHQSRMSVEQLQQSSHAQQHAHAVSMGEERARLRDRLRVEHQAVAGRICAEREALLRSFEAERMRLQQERDEERKKLLSLLADTKAAALRRELKQVEHGISNIRVADRSSSSESDSCKEESDELDSSEAPSREKRRRRRRRSGRG